MGNTLTVKKNSVLSGYIIFLQCCRFSRYIKMKFKTVREGQQAVVYNNFGEGRLLEGPKRVSQLIYFDCLRKRRIDDH